MIAGRMWILASVAGGPAAARDVAARVGDDVVLHAAIETRDRHGCVWMTSAEEVEGPCRRAPISLGPEVQITWSKVEADQKAYDNVPKGVFRAAPIGWIETAWIEGAWSVHADVAPVVRAGLRQGAGTMRYRVALEAPGGVVLRSPGPRDGEPGGPKQAEDARKVTLRLDDSYLGYMSELANLPYIYGSTELGNEPHQAERAIGVDCADLMIYGLRRMGLAQAYLSSRTLSPISTHIASAVRKDQEGRYVDANGDVIEIGERGVRPGDWIIFDGHVGAFVEDRGIRGVLDGEDLLMHIAWKELAIESMMDSGYGGLAFEVRRAKALSH